MKKKSNLDILKKCAKKLGYKVEMIDSKYSDAISVSDETGMFIARSKKRFGMYPSNPKFAEHLVDNKALTKNVLKKRSFRVIRGKLFYIKPPTYKQNTKIDRKDSLSAAFEYADNITYPVFVKPNSGSMGENARIIFNKTALRSHITKMSKEGVMSFLVEKFTNRPEYRLFVVNGKVEFMYRKERAVITGDGVNTIDQLIKFSEIEPDETYLQSLLRWEKKTRGSILGNEHQLPMQETANISTGAKIVDYQDKAPKNVNSWADRLYKTTGLGVFGVDVFTKDGIGNPQEYLIIEINSNPALAGIYAKGHTEKVLDIWKKIIRNYFKKI